jgi:stress response protein YsnF
MTTVISAYDDQKLAEKAIAALREEGFEDSAVQILQGDATTLASELTGHGFEEDDARAYVRAAEAGRTLVLARVSEEQADRAVSILDRVATGAEGAVPIVEEELSVSKAKRATGGVRVTSSVIETPVEESVTLREESVEAELRPVDRALDADEAEAAFREKTVERMGTVEDVEVHKQARVVGEVEIRKEAEERQATVRDTVRRTDVEVEEVGVGAKRKN